MSLSFPAVFNFIKIESRWFATEESQTMGLFGKDSEIFLLISAIVVKGFESTMRFIFYFF